MKSINNNRQGYVPRFGWCRDSMLKSWSEGIYGEGIAADGDEWCAVRSADFLFLSGEPADTAELAEYINNSMGKYATVIPEHSGWFEPLCNAGARIKKMTRYHTRLPEGGFDRELLERFAAYDAECVSILKAGKNEYELLKNCDWENCFVSNFKDREDFFEHGLGYVCIIGGELASAATTFGYYSGGYEIQLATAPKFRRRGLAAAVSAAFLLECLDRGKTPHWDAANMTSVRIAQRLGFVFDGEYEAFDKVPEP